MYSQDIIVRKRDMGKKTKILLVEDNPADVQLTTLTIANFTDAVELVCYANGLELLQALPALHLPEIQLVLLDLNMPKMGGIETLRQLARREDWSQIPVVIFTSSAHYEDIQTCYELGANAYVNKPVDYNEFAKAIQTILEFWTEINIYNNLG